MDFIVSAPGKIILVGEHAVVYGSKAIASSINLRCEAHVSSKAANNNCVLLHLTNIPFDFSLTESEFNLLKKDTNKYHCQPISSTYQSILSNFLKDKIPATNNDTIEYIKPGITVFIDLYMQLMPQFTPLDITIISQFTYGCGLGSSAAYSTVLSTSLLLISHQIPRNAVTVDGNFLPEDLSLISKFSFRGEEIVHGNPSGIDNSISTFGRTLVFQRCVSTGEMIKNDMSLPNLKVLLIDTNVKRCTQTVVKYVRKLMHEQPSRYQAWFSDIHEITKSMEVILSEPNNNQENFITDMNELIEENQRLLQLLGVSHPTIEEIVNILKFYGISSKLTGAGWGGCVYGIINGIDKSQLQNAMNHLSDRGYGALVANLGCTGVSLIL